MKRKEPQSAPKGHTATAVGETGSGSGSRRERMSGFLSARDEKQKQQKNNKNQTGKGRNERVGSGLWVYTSLCVCVFVCKCKQTFFIVLHFLWFLGFLSLCCGCFSTIFLLGFPRSCSMLIFTIHCYIHSSHIFHFPQFERALFISRCTVFFPFVFFFHHF